MKEGIYRNLSELEVAADVLRVIRNVDGWLTDVEAIALYLAARNGNAEGEIVEIGSFKGRSTIVLALGSKDAGRELVYSVDTHKGSVEHQVGGEYSSHMPLSGTTEGVFRSNIQQAGVDDWVKPIVKSSEEAVSTWNNIIRLLFIDASHDYQDVSQDFRLWERFVPSEGLVIFHDVDRLNSLDVELVGPSRVVYEDVVDTGNYSDPIIVNHLAFLQKI